MIDEILHDVSNIWILQDKKSKNKLYSSYDSYKNGH